MVWKVIELSECRNKYPSRIQDSTYCFDCNSILISHRRED